MNTKRILLGILLVLFIMTMSTSSAAAVIKDNGNMLQASFYENGVHTHVRITTNTNDVTNLHVDQYMNDTLFCGSKDLNKDEFKIKNNLASAKLTSSIVISQYPMYFDPSYSENIELNNLEVTWESTEKPDVTKVKWIDSLHDSKGKYSSVNAIATGSVDGLDIGQSLYASMSAYKHMDKV